MSRPALVLCALGVLLVGFLGRVPDGRSDQPGKKKGSPPAGKNAPKPEPAKTKSPPKAERATTAKQTAPLRNKLAEVVSLPNGIEANSPLRDALDFLADQFEITVLVDSAAFKETGVDNVEDMPVHLPRMKDVRLDTVLRALASQLSAVPLLRPDHVEITTAQRAVEIVWGNLQADEEPEQSFRPRPALPLVNIAFVNTALDAALRELVEQTGVSVVLDLAHAAERARVPVTATLDNVPFDNAVRLLAGQADLQAVLLDNALYVTTPQHAQGLRNEQDAVRPADGRTPETALAQQLRQPVDLAVDEVPLSTIVKTLARETGIKIVIDRRAHKEADLGITLHVKSISAETALRLAAEQAGLKPVLVGEVFFITTEAHAARMQAEQERALVSATKAFNGMNLGGLGALGALGGNVGLAAGGLGALGGGGLGIGGGMLGFSGGMPTGASPKLIGSPAEPAKPDSNPRPDGRPPRGKLARPDGARGTPRFVQTGQKLTEPVTLEKGIDANTPLKEALEFLHEQFDLPTILIDTAAFKAEGVGGVEDMPVKLRRIHGVRLGTILQKLAEQVNGAVLVRVDRIELTTREAKHIEVWGRPPEPPERPRYLPLTHAAFEQKPLEEALRELASTTGFNVLLDARHAGEKNRTVVTAALNNVPLDTAVRILADMADLHAVLLDDVLLVTTREQARALRIEHERRNQRGLDFPGALKGQPNA